MFFRSFEKVAKMRSIKQQALLREAVKKKKGMKISIPSIFSSSFFVHVLNHPEMQRKKFLGTPPCQVAWDLEYFQNWASE